MKGGPDNAINQFLKADILTTPKYHQHSKQADDLMHMRTDSRGLPVRRTFIGTKEQFFDAEALMAKRERERNKQKKKKKSSTFHNLLPNIVSPR